MLCIYHVPGICNLCLTTVWTAATLATYINGLPQNLPLSLPNWKIVSLKNSLLKILNVFLSVCYTQFLKSLGSHSRKLWCTYGTDINGNAILLDEIYSVLQQY